MTIVDIISAVVTNVVAAGYTVNYIHGHPIDVFNQLSEMAMHPTDKIDRFPIIALMQDFEEEGNAGLDGVGSIDIIIAIDTKPEFTASERYTNSFDVTLYPLYESFIYYLERSPDVYWRRANKTKIDRLYWGKTGALGNEENKSSDFIDAIELNIKELNVLQTC